MGGHAITSDAELDRLEEEWEAAKEARVGREDQIARASYDAGPDDGGGLPTDAPRRAEMDSLKEAQEDALEAYNSALRTRRAGRP
jgi:hypothetical protein